MESSKSAEGPCRSKLEATARSRAAPGVFRPMESSKSADGPPLETSSFKDNGEGPRPRKPLSEAAAAAAALDSSVCNASLDCGKGGGHAGGAAPALDIAGTCAAAVAAPTPGITT